MVEIKVSDSVRKKLLAFRDRNKKARWSRDLDPIEKQYNAVCLWADIGGASYLSFDGKGIYHNFDADEIIFLKSQVEMNQLLIYGSEKCPTLKQLLPQRPSDALECQSCSGRGFVKKDISKAIYKREDAISCNVCGGVGWCAT